MKKAILPCNGLDKPLGKISRNLAIKLSRLDSSDIICPVLYSQYPHRYNADEYELTVIDGCPAKCATKLAASTFNITKRYLVSDILKMNKLKHPLSISPEEDDSAIVHEILTIISKAESEMDESSSVVWDDETIHYRILKKDKYQFRIPENESFLFTENDTWCYVNKTVARIGVTDFVQQNLSDILFFNTPETGKNISQFDDVGSIESSKAVFEVISPVSGTILRYNAALVEHPEWINENPYEKGWIAEILLIDLEADRTLLLKTEDYYKILYKKVMNYEKR